MAHYKKTIQALNPQSRDRYRRILGHFNPSISSEITIPPSPEQELASIPIIGFSATFSRHDGLSLGTVFQRIVYHRDFLEMIKERWHVL